MSRRTGDARKRLSDTVRRFTGRRVLVLGDPMLDAYVYGTTHRISREAPVLIVREDGREARLGGAANAAHNLAALGARPFLIGAIGRDENGATLADVCARAGIGVEGLCRPEGWKTVSKTRILAGGVHTTKQQMLRLDQENDAPLDAAGQTLLSESFDRHLASCEAVVISDYGSGLAPLFADCARRARALHKVVVVDSRYALMEFGGVSAVTPNEPEAAEALGLRFASPGEALAGARAICGALSLDAAILTRGNQGMAIADRAGGGWLFPCHGAPEAVDVTGAGDTVTAAVALALAAGASVLEAAALANCAASRVVQFIGAATLSADDLLREIEALGPEVAAVLS